MPRTDTRVEMEPRWLERQRAQAEADPTIRREIPDAVEPGLRLEVRGGRLTWSVRYLADGKHKRLPLGAYPAVGLAQARKEARSHKGDVAKGSDPHAQRRAAREAAQRRRLGETVKGAVGNWLKDGKRGPAGRWKGGLTGGTARSFLPHVRALVRELGAQPLAEVAAKDLEKFVTRPQAAATRNRRLTALRLFFAWALRKGLVEASPAAGLEKEREKERRRVLTDGELRAMICGFDATRWGRAVRLLALTGLRRDEVLGLRWAWCDLEAAVLTLPPEAEKAGAHRGEPRHVPLSTAAVSLLAAQRAANFAEGNRGPFVFTTTTTKARLHRDGLKPTLNVLRGRRPNGTVSTHKKAKERTAVLPADVSVHDLRRTVADALLRRLGAAPWVVDHVVLGHVRPKLLRTYMPTLPLDEARAALEKWGSELGRVLGEDAAFVVR